MFKECGRRHMTEAYLSYKLSKRAFGSGELKIDQMKTLRVELRKNINSPTFSVWHCNSKVWVSFYNKYKQTQHVFHVPFGPRQANLVLIPYASSEGSGEPAHPRSLARTSAAHLYKQ